MYATTKPARSVTEALDLAAGACDALRRTSATGLTDEQRLAWSVAFSAIQALAGFIEDEPVPLTAAAAAPSGVHAGYAPATAVCECQHPAGEHAVLMHECLAPGCACTAFRPAPGAYCAGCGYLLIQALDGSRHCQVAKCSEAGKTVAPAPAGAATGLTCSYCKSTERNPRLREATSVSPVGVYCDGCDWMHANATSVVDTPRFAESAEVLTRMADRVREGKTDPVADACSLHALAARLAEADADREAAERDTVRWQTVRGLLFIASDGSLESAPSVELPRQITDVDTAVDWLAARESRDGGGSR